MCLVAGCLGGEPVSEAAESPGPTGPTGSPGISDTPAPTGPPGPPEPPAPVVVPVDWSGRLGSVAVLCETAVTRECAVHEFSPDDSGFIVEGFVGSVTGARLALSWTPQSVATERLGFGVMVMTPGCSECDQSSIAEAEGVSPIEINVGDADAALEPGAVVHLYVYAMPVVVGPAVAWAHAEQAFRVEGAVTVEPASG